MQLTPVRKTHDQYMHEMHPDFRRIIRGKKHVMRFDRDGRPHWVPVEIVPRGEATK